MGLDATGVLYIVSGVMNCVLLVVIMRYTVELWQRRRLLSIRGVTFLALMASLAMTAVTGFGRLGSSSFVPWLFTYALSQHFMFTSYFLVLLYWIGAYNLRCPTEKMRVVFPELKAPFVILNILDIVIRVVASILKTNPDNMEKYNIGRYLLAIWTVVTGVGLGLSFFIIGMRITYTLKSNEYTDSTWLYRMTVKTSVISIILCITGIVVGVTLHFTPAIGSPTFTAIETIILWVLPLLMFLIVKPNRLTAKLFVGRSSSVRDSIIIGRGRNSSDYATHQDSATPPKLNTQVPSSTIASLNSTSSNASNTPPG